MEEQLLPRFYQDLETWLKPGKVLLIYGPRQVGKTTLVKQYLKTTPWRYRFDSGDDLSIQEIFSSRRLKVLRQYVGSHQLIVIDEAQKIPFVGESLKILVDQMPQLRIIATGSSSFELAGQVGEPLTGRKQTLILYPLALLELKEIFPSPWDLEQQLDQLLIFGSYPEVVRTQDPQKKRLILQELVNSYLLKDILTLEKIKASQKLVRLLQLLAFQIGSTVSLTELGQQLELDRKTVARYLDLLEKSFIIFSLWGYHRNLRKAISKKNKYYFFDLGVRNALINNFNPLELRPDLGQLWENFVIIERRKKQAYWQIYSNNYFWRTWDGQEVDWVEERDGQLFGFEIKWSEKKKAKEPKDWSKTYPKTSWQLITPENFLDFVA